VNHSSAAELSAGPAATVTAPTHNRLTLPAMVKVYSFMGWNEAAGEMQRGLCKMTREAIKRQNFDLIEGTGEDVPARKVDADGRYYRQS